MRKIYHIMLMSAGMALFTSCLNDDTDFSGIIDGDGDYVPKSIEFDTTPLEEAAEVIPSGDNDYVENAGIRYHVTVHYADDVVTFGGDVARVRATANGGHVIINSTVSGVEYILTGRSDDGSFKLYSENKMKVTLAGLSLCNPTGAAINNQCGKSMYVELPSGTGSVLSDGAVYNEVEGEDMKGTFFSEGQVIFSGSGNLVVRANCRHAIVSDDYIVFRPGNVINVDSKVGSGVKANDGIFIRGGVLNINVEGDAAKGLNSELDMTVSGGRTTVITSGNATVQADDASSCAAIKCDSLFTVTAGTLNLKSTGDGGKGINCDKHILVTGGEVNVVTLGKKTISSPKGIKADGDITFNGGAVYSYSKHSDAIDAAMTFGYADGWLSVTGKAHLFEIAY
ncbi:MAG: carbohydrate-binding domain-containing protein [Bacteroides sp.]|nr:carbohydrate-binding domain-containing protein [Bacteroides sp.]MCM1447101.1 carbohydrate-binding domain-containing protein [Bacteroides sp.]